MTVKNVTTHVIQPNQKYVLNYKVKKPATPFTKYKQNLQKTNLPTR